MTRKRYPPCTNCAHVFDPTVFAGHCYVCATYLLAITRDAAFKLSLFAIPHRAPHR